MKRFFSYGTLFTLVVLSFARSDGDSGDKASAKEALQALNEFIGEWKGNGAPDKPRPASKELWSETVSWTWRFKGDDAWLTLSIKDGRYFKSGELRYLTDKKRYQLTAIDKNDKKLVFDGELKNGYLTLERADKDKKEVQQLLMNTAADGVRFIYRYKSRPEGKKLFTPGYMVACNKEGESLAGKEKGKVCPVSGGLGKIAVTYKGETYYVCCTGCRDAFNEDPEKYVKEFKAKKK